MSDFKKKRPSPGTRSKISPTSYASNRPSSSKTPSSEYLAKSNDNQKGAGVTKVQKTQSYDRVRKIVQEEGRTARNLIAWNVPVQSSDKGSTNHGNPNEAPLKPLRVRSTSDSKSGSKGRRKSSGRTDSPVANKGAQAGTTKKDLRARYWAFLFDNLKRAVDEIYSTCEADESVVECKEAIMIMEQCTNDFKSLIDRLEIIRAYENADKDSRPTSLAWEVRKISPAKHPLGSPTAGLLLHKEPNAAPSNTVARSINFNNTKPQAPMQPPPRPAIQPVTPLNTGAVKSTWADKVKRTTPVQELGSGDRAPEPVTPSTPDTSGLDSAGTTPVSNRNSISLDSPPVPAEDGDGWETVHKSKHGKLRKNHSGSMSKLSTSSTESKSSRSRPQAGRNQKAVALSNNKNGSATPRSKPNTPRTEPQSARAIRSSTGIAESQKTVMNGIAAEDGKNGSPRQDVKPEEAKEQKAAATAATEIVPLMSKVFDKSTRSAPSVMSGSKEELKTPPCTPSELGTPTAAGTPKKVVGETIIKTSESKDSGIGSKDLPGTPNSEEELSELNTSDIKDEEEEKALETVLSSLLDQEQHLDQELQQANADAQCEELGADSQEESELMSSGNSLQQSQTSQTMNWDTMVKMFEAENEHKKWGDMVDEDDSEYLSRTPGRGVHMHEKLSSPSRKRPLHPSREKYEEKQAKARELREKLMQDRAERVKALTKKVEEVKTAKEHVMQQKKDLMERKLQRAQEKRKDLLDQKVKRAHEEKNKASEIAFIMNLEAQNKKIDIINKHQESEARLQDLQEERQRKHEEKAAKEAAAEERRRALEAGRQARLQKMESKWQAREEAAKQRQAEIASQKSEARRVKEKEHEDRVAALQAQHQAHIEELSKKIKQKQDETDRRHQENLHQIQKKAFEMSILRYSTEDQTEAPLPGLYEPKKFCAICNVMIASEVYLSSHLQGKKHKAAMREAHAGQELTKEEIESFNLQNILDAPSDKPDPQLTHDRERQMTLRKRCKKLRQRMAQRGSEYETSAGSKQQTYVEAEHKAKFQKVTKDLNKLLKNQDRGPWPQSKISTLDRASGEITRAMDKKMPGDQLFFKNCGGLSAMLELLSLIPENNKNSTVVIPVKSFILASNALRSSCKDNLEICHYLLFSNKISVIIDVLSHKLQSLVPDNLGSLMIQSTDSALPQCPLSNALLNLLSTVLGQLAVPPKAAGDSKSNNSSAFTSRTSDVISYITSVGVVDKVSLFFHNVSGPLQEGSPVVEFVNNSLCLLNSLLRLLTIRSGDDKAAQAPAASRQLTREDTTQLLSTLRDTDLCGLVPLLYGLLLHRGAGSRGPHDSGEGGAPPLLPNHITAILLTAFKLLNSLAVLDISLLQSTLGSEGMSLELRHISSFLLWHCTSTNSCAPLLHEVVLCVGYFTLMQTDNQLVMQSGQPPTVLQQLCQLPFEYFSSPQLMMVLFPSLIACCYQCPENTACLQQELSPDLLIKFLEEQLKSIGQDAVNTTKQKPPAQKSGEARFHLTARVPRTEWNKILEYFKS